MQEKELRACAVHGEGPARHGDNSGFVAYIVLRKAVGGKFALDIVAGAARADTVGISALNHEAVDYAVKGQAGEELLVIC